MYRIPPVLGHDAWRLECDGSLLATAATFEDVVAYFSGHSVFMAALAGLRHCYLHSGGVVVDGRAVLFPGRSGAGKSTITAALLRAGAAYLSDEYALIDDEGLVHGFPRPLSLDNGRGGFDLTDPASVGSVAPDPVPVELVVLTEFDPTRTVTFEDRALRAAEALSALLPFATSLQANPVGTMRRLEALVRRTSVVRASRGESDDFARAVIERLTAE